MLKPLACAVSLLVCPSMVSAQDLAGEVAVLREEMAQLRAELAELRRELASRAPGAGPAASVDGAVAGAPSLEMLQAQLAEQAQTKVESATRFPLKVSGSIVSETFLNSGSPNWLDLPNVNKAAAGADEGSFSSTLRQSRIGFEAGGLTVGAWQASGVLTFDFFGGIPTFQTGQVMGLPRLLYAFARLDKGATTLVVGQDEAIVAPRSPTSMSAFSFPALYRSGNLYLREPQARVETRISTGAGSRVRLIGGIAAPIAGDFGSDLYTFVPPELSGERSERPALQGRAVWELSHDDLHAVALGVSAHHASQDVGTSVDSWIGAVDFDVQWGAVGLAGEAFVADRAGAFGAALGQQARTRGGWAEVRFTPVERWRVVIGAGTDRLKAHLTGLQALKRNGSALASLRYSLSPELAVGAEYAFLRTTPVAGDERTNHQVNWVLRYDF